MCRSRETESNFDDIEASKVRFEFSRSEHPMSFENENFFRTFLFQVPVSGIYLILSMV